MGIFPFGKKKKKKNDGSLLELLSTSQVRNATHLFWLKIFQQARMRMHALIQHRLATTYLKGIHDSLLQSVENAHRFRAHAKVHFQHPSGSGMPSEFVQLDVTEALDQLHQRGSRMKRRLAAALDAHERGIAHHLEIWGENEDIRYFSIVRSLSLSQLV